MGSQLGLTPQLRARTPSILAVLFYLSICNLSQTFLGLPIVMAACKRIYEYWRYHTAHAPLRWVVPDSDVSASDLRCLK